MKRIAAMFVLLMPLAGAAFADGTGPRALGGPRPTGRDGEVRGVSVVPGAGTVGVVIDVTGTVEVRDFTLSTPARLVVDLIGARLTGPAVLYDGQNRGGIKNVRYAQFRQDVVRVVLELDALSDYKVERRTGTVRVDLGTDRTAFATWSSRTMANFPTVAAAARAATAPASRNATAAGRVSAPQANRPMTIADYLAAHKTEAAQSQAPRVTVQWDAASVEEVVAGFAAFSGRTIVLGKGVQGTITAEIKNQPWDLAFNAVLESQGLGHQVLPGGIIHVLNKADLARADSTVPVETRLVRINYARAGSLQPAVASMVTKPRGSVVADSTTNSLVITDVQTRIAQVEEFVRALDIRTPQVSIQAKIIFVDRQDIEQLGVKYDLGSQSQFFNQLVQRPDPSTAQPVDTDLDGVPDALVPTELFDANQTIVDLGGNSLSALGNAGQAILSPALELIFSTAIGNFDLTSFISALQSIQLLDVQAEPVISTLDNRSATIFVGERVPLRVIDASTVAGGEGAGAPRATVRFEEVGIKLNVTPHVTANRQVLMEVHAERSGVIQQVAVEGFTFQTQEADNQILVADGETAVIGGLTVTEVTVAKSGIPFLVDLPILGKLFGFSRQQETRRDLLILITPHIVDDLVTK